MVICQHLAPPAELNPITSELNAKIEPEMEQLTPLQRLEALADRKIPTESVTRPSPPRANWITGNRRNPPSREPKPPVTFYKLNEARKWYADVRAALEDTLPQGHPLRDEWATVMRPIHKAPGNARVKSHLDMARGIVTSACEVLRNGYRSQQGECKYDIIVQVLRRFHTGIGTITERRRKGKQAKFFAIEDEYDVQDLLFAALKPYVSDLACEVPVPKCAGDSGRIDFTSKSSGLGLEVKFAKDTSRARDIARECRERVFVYQGFPGIRRLIFFIYDPDRRLEDPDNFISDMSGSHVRTPDQREITMDVIISPPRL